MFMRTCYAQSNKQKEPGRPCIHWHMWCLQIRTYFDVSCVSSQWCFRSLASADAQAVASSRGQEGDYTTMKLVQIQLKEEMTFHKTAFDLFLKGGIFLRQFFLRSLNIPNSVINLSTFLPQTLTRISLCKTLPACFMKNRLFWWHGPLCIFSVMSHMFSEHS